jgi:hypothetical protein
MTPPLLRLWFWRLPPAFLALCFLLPLRSGAASWASAVAADARVQSLDGAWQIVSDPHDQGRAAAWNDPARFPRAAARPIQVPGNINEAWPNPTPLGSPESANLAWYCRTFTPEKAEPGRRSYVRFGAVRYLSEVWLNGTDLGSHEGGESPFEYDATGLLRPGQTNTLIVRVASPVLGGINQHVALVSQPVVRIVDGFARPNAQAKEIRLEVTLENNSAAPASVEVTADFGEFKPARSLGSQTLRVAAPLGRSTAVLVLPVPEPQPWSPEHPFLYTVKIASRWREAPAESAGRDDYFLRTGFRDFRIVDGFFYLNGKRIFLKSTHGNWYDPVVIQGTPRSMKYLSQDPLLLKQAGFNTMRFITFAALPEQLDEADEKGLMIYSEHETSWELFLKDPAKFGITLNQVVRRDRNHPSLVMWGLLNETASLDIYRRAKAWLPSLRAVDDTRLIMLSSGRWDNDFKTGSASNPGSPDWNVYLGGDDPVHPAFTGDLEMGNHVMHGSGDFHVYARYPTSWKFITEYENLARTTRPFFQSEDGDGSSFDPLDEQRELQRAGAPANAFAWAWVNPAVQGLQATWKTYGLDGVYPSIEAMLRDSALAQSRQRARTFSRVRGNPKVNGFNLTSLNDAWGSGEGFIDNFRHFKPGHLEVLQAGWAPVRWCLLIDSSNVYPSQPLHLRASLANEDQLPAGAYPALFKISGPQGVVWRQAITIRIGAGADAPMAWAAFDGDISLAGAGAGTYVLEAELSGRPNAAAGRLEFTVTAPRPPQPLGAVTTLGLEPSARTLLQQAGAVLHDYSADQPIDREVILVGGDFRGTPEVWRELYSRCARGAAVVFLAPEVFLTDPKAGRGTLQGLPLRQKGTLARETEWLYHKEVVAKNGPAFTGLEVGLMTPDYYQGVLAETPYFSGIAVPDETEAVAIRCVGIIASPGEKGGPGFFEYRDGVMLGTYRHHAGRFTINALHLLQQLGNPAADALLLNLAAEARAHALPLQPLPADYNAELTALGFP